MGTRLDLQTLLEGLAGVSAVYFQPPANVVMTYPAIVYNKFFETSVYADNAPYLQHTRYRLTIIDADPDSAIPGLVAALPMSAFVRHFTLSNLNHDVYDVYF